MDIKEQLKKYNLSVTSPRISVFRQLMESKIPLSQKQICQLADAEIDKTTIYRILELFISKGLVHKAYTKDGVDYFELSHHCDSVMCHPHFHCTNCKKSWCLYDTKLAVVEGLSMGFIVKRQTVSLEGLCADCSGIN